MFSTKSTSFTIESPNAVPEPGSGVPRRAAFMGDRPLTGLPENVNSGWDFFTRTCDSYPEYEYLGYRPIVDGVAQAYVWETYAQVRDRVDKIAGALVHKGYGKETAIGIYSTNCPEWLVTALACYRQDFVPVPLYDSLGTEAVEYIISQSEMTLAFVAESKLSLLLQHAAKFPLLKTIVVYGTPNADDLGAAAALDVELVSFTDLEALGAEHPSDPSPATHDSIAVICYTSGTTGKPKGAMITHRNIISCTHSASVSLDAGTFPKIAAGDTHLSYLPLAHSFEMYIQFIVLEHGGRVGFSQGNPRKIIEDMQELKPSCFISVPRLLNRVYDEVWSGVRSKGGITKAVFQAAYASKVQWLKAGRIKSMILDAAIFAKMRALLGGHARFILTGSAPLAPEVIKFFRVCFSVDVIEGYGQTECAAATTLTWTGDYDSGHVGAPLSCNEIKLLDVPAMSYTSADLPNPRGEICVRGTNVFKGYYKDPAKTAEAIDADGWLRTGDVGMWDARGRLVVIDRVKNLFKLSQGEYVSPERVEGVYQACPLVAQVFVHGNPLKSSTVGVVVPDVGELLAWAVGESFLVADPETGKAPKGTDIAALLARPEVAAAATKVLQAHGKAAGLKGFENVRAAHWEHDAWSVDNNLLTPTFKLKRIEARAKYEQVFDALYAAMDAQDQA